MSLEDVVAKVKGPAGSTVTLTLRSAADSQTRDVQVKRAVIQIESVSWAMTPGTTIAHVYIAAFSGGASADLRQALTEARDQGATAVILDLRDDAGGLLEEAVTSASQFLSSGNVVLRRDAQGKETPMAVEAGGVDPDLPMVVLVNGGTASAAEIVAGALQDAGRASLIGTQTFGTGTVLRQFLPLRWLRPLAGHGGVAHPRRRTIWHQGLTPDQVVDLPAGVVPLTPDDLKDMTADQVQASQDAQFLDALAALQSTEQTLSAAPLG
jgi:carboxyl-terminal processing protease